ncbi:MAG: hypothetical protein ACKN81_15910 [Pirellulaceae bacterium]
MIANRLRWPKVCLHAWPGWTKLWNEGDLRSLLLSLLFGALLNLWFAATWTWPQWWTTQSWWSCLAALAVSASASALLAKDSLRSLAMRQIPAKSTDQWLRDAQDSYLQANYQEAEASLHRIFAAGNQDIEAMLLMISVLRRTGRIAQAQFCIDRLRLLERANPWLAELDHEQKKLRQLLMAPDANSN